MEIRFHSRGGEGAVSACEMLVGAFTKEGKYASGFPMFGFERRGAPVTAFLRYSDQPIREKTMIYNPDCLIISDRYQVDSPMSYAGFRSRGILVANSRQPLEKKPNDNVKIVGTVDATEIALTEIGVLAVNSCLMGSFAAVTGWLQLESILWALEKRFEGDLLRKNIRSVERGFSEVKIFEY
ncbi:MAG: 2-oxoacid:acceptor oxidoreductase family protein [Desulfatiglans sp.]|jgi:2-oxoacid:acceptor oxidoreductase gamma subunit (pyruvate/2-ketoisovalerate family)|nr:2-oxoacid:acceptor oxidoreductase family protein [Desulfatiglans sp.]